MTKETVTTVDHHSRQAKLLSFEASFVQFIHTFEQRGVIAQDVLFLFIEKGAQQPKQWRKEPVETEGNGLNLRQVSIWTFHEAVDAHLCQRREEFVPIAVFINRRTTSFNFLSQSIKETGQAVLDVTWPLSNDSQVSKPSLVQSANMIEVHYVFEDETAASLHFVSKNQSGLQGLAIIDLAAT